jgi:hypothetical protein
MPARRRACREGPSTPGRAQAAEAGADDAEVEDAVDEGTDADWVALASAPAAAQRAPRALPPVRPAAAAADDSPGLEERTWAAAAAARRAAATPAGSESIVGPDDRIRVTNTTAAPWCAPRRRARPRLRAHAAPRPRRVTAAAAGGARAGGSSAGWSGS